jgi:hypothetical protein
VNLAMDLQPLEVGEPTDKLKEIGRSEAPQLIHKFNLLEIELCTNEEFFFSVTRILVLS